VPQDVVAARPDRAEGAEGSLRWGGAIGSLKFKWKVVLDPPKPADSRTDRFLTVGLGLLLAGTALAHAQHPFLNRGLFAGALFLLTLRLGRNLWLAKSGRLAWGRLAIPGLLLVEGGAAFANLGPQGLVVKGFTVGLLELGLLWLAWKAWRESRAASGCLPEERLSQRFQAFLGPRAARLVAMELVVLGGVVQVLSGWTAAADPRSFTYHRDSALGSLLLALPVMAVADVLLLDLLLRHGSPWIRWGVHALDFYGLIWVLGLWQSMRARPHCLDDESLWIHRGVLGNLRIPRASVGAVRTLPFFDVPAERRAFLGDAANLGVSGGTELLLELAEQLRPMGFLGPGKPRNRVLLTADDPEAFRRALEV
jgi:hypothetical protein